MSYLSKDKEWYPSINGWRSVGVILVIFSHLNIKYPVFDRFSDNLIWGTITSFIHDGNLGVNVFFIVSGFLISSLLIEEERNFKKISIRKFYMRRFLRIFPAYYFLLLVYFILQLYDVIEISDRSWFTSLVFIKYINWFMEYLTSHLWSLSIEENFYLLFPLLFLLGDKFRKRVVIFLFLMPPISRVVYHFSDHMWINNLSFTSRIDAICIGCFCAFYKDWILEKIGKSWKNWFYLAVIGMFSLRFLNMLSYRFELEILFVPFGVTYGTFANVFIALIIMYSIYGPQKWLYRFLNTRIMTFIGMISYSLYLWQQLFIYADLGWFSVLPLNIICFFGMALISYYFIERPFLKLKTKFENNSRKEVAQ